MFDLIQNKYHHVSCYWQFSRWYRSGISQDVIIVSIHYSLCEVSVWFFKFLSCFYYRDWALDHTHGWQMSYHVAEFLLLYFPFLSSRFSLWHRSWPWTRDPPTPCFLSCFPSFLLNALFFFSEGHSSDSFEHHKGRGQPEAKREMAFPSFHLLSDLLGAKGKSKPQRPSSLAFIGGDDSISSISMDDWMLPCHHCVWYSDWCYHFLALHVEKADELLGTSNL